MGKRLVLVKYHNPTRYDHAPYGTLWHVINDALGTDIVDRFIQTSHDEHDPAWHTLAHVLMVAFKDDIDSDDSILEKCLVRFTAKTNS